MKASQNSRILRYLMKGKSLTPLQALRLFDSWRLARCIGDLRKEGFPIVTTMVTRKKKRFAKYTLDHQATLGI